MSTSRLNFVKVLTKSFLKKSLNPTSHLNIRYASFVKKKPETSMKRPALVAAAFGASIGASYSLYESFFASKSDSKMIEQKSNIVIEKLPDIKITKKIYNPNDKSDLDLVLFQFQTCPFCCKVRAFLDYYGFSYSLVEVDAVLRQQLSWSEYRKVPLLLARKSDGKYVQLTDSSTIISILASFLKNNEQDIWELSNLYPTMSYFNDKGKKTTEVMNKYFLMFEGKTTANMSKKEIEEERKWRIWADKELVHLISPNVYRTFSESIETFKWFSEAGEWKFYFPAWEEKMMVYLGAIAMWGISKRLKKRHNLSDDVRSDMYNALKKWTAALDEKNSKFMGGKLPNLADICVYGVLCSMEGCSAFDDCLKNIKFRNWFYGIKKLVNENKGKQIGESSMLPEGVYLN